MKKALNINAQIQRLKEHGMLFNSEEKAKEILLDIGYYRLGFYSFPFEQTFPQLENRNHLLNKDTTFTSVVELYYFDNDLRHLLTTYINRIEINIRTQITYIVSNYYPLYPTWFANPNVMNRNYIQNFDKTVYSTIIENPVIKHHHTKYINDKYAPAWKTIEFMTLGNLSVLYLNIKEQKLQTEIARHYQCSYSVFVNYLETFRVLRNKCAHGNCLYNINLSKGIKIKPANINEADKHNIKGCIEVVKYFLKQISINRLHDLNKHLEQLLSIERSKQTKDIIKKCTGLY